MAILDPFLDYSTFLPGHTEWGPWKRKFAWAYTVVSGKGVWLKFYYFRTGIRTSAFGCADDVYQTASDMFDVLKYA